MKPPNRQSGLRVRKADLRYAVSVRRERGLRRKVSVASVRRAVRRTLEHQAFHRSCSVSVFLAGEDTLAALNSRYRGVDRATDVLSFAAGNTDPETGFFHLGEIVISIPHAVRQASARAHPLEREISLLAVHGTLHLLGHDHAKAAGKNRMWRAQREILKDLQD